MERESLWDFETRGSPVIPAKAFASRLLRSGIIAATAFVVSLGLGIAGYHYIEQLSWLDSFLNSSMLLGGMGPVDMPVTDAGKVFAGLYALYAGLVVIFAASIILAPIAHRLLHQFHMEADEPGPSS